MNLKKKALILLLVLVLAVTGVYGSLTVYWSRTIQGQTFRVLGISAELLNPDAISYRDKIVATSLTDNQVALTIYEENFYNLWLVLNYSTNAEGLNVSVSGQYCVYYLSTIGSTPTISNVGSAFPMIFDNNTIDKTKMMYYAPTKNDDPKTGGLLMLTFTVDTEFVTLPGDYNITYGFSMGFWE